MTWHAIKEAAPLIGLSDGMVYRLCESGRLAHRRIGLKKGRGRIQISGAAIEAFLKGCEIAAEEKPAPAPQNARRPQKTRTFSGRPDGKPLKRQW